MYEEIMNYLAKWKATKDNREQIQDVYLVLGCVIVLLSGLITFLNSSLGYAMVSVGLVLLGAWLLNAVSWHLISSALLSKIKKPKARRK